VLRLVTLGRLELLRDGSCWEAVPVQPKRLALLVYLAVAAPTPAGFHRRDTLLALFWPEHDHAEARRALRQALYHLRNVLGDGILLNRNGDEVGLANGGLWCDARALEEALDARRPREALALYQGEFLSGVFVADASAELEEWVSRVRRRLRARVAAAAWTVVEQESRAGNLVGALEVARKARELDPDDEPGLRRLMRLLDRLGDRAGALRVYVEFARRLREEYGAEPAAETSMLADALRGCDGSGGLQPVTVESAFARRSLVERRRSSPTPTIQPAFRGPSRRRVAVGVALAALGALATIGFGKPIVRL
jgi:DNA-binding SARP family transcriptional activator